jgi:hypothetical protein
MATMIKTLQRELHAYISEISEPADVRARSPLPLFQTSPARMDVRAMNFEDASLTVTL